MDEIDWERIGRYLAGEVTPEERMEIRTWIEAAPERGELVRSLEEIWQVTAELPVEHRPELGRVWDRVSTEALQRTGKVIPLRRRRRPPAASRGWLPWGVGAAAAAASLVFLLQPGSMLRPEPASQVAVRDIVTGSGERATVKLADGTEIQLAAGSRLRVPLDFGSNGRTVELSGMAFFAVSPDRSRPFLVRAGHGVVRVLGTEFVVRGYPGSDVEVGVSEGRVTLGAASGSSTPLLLTVGNRGRVAVGGELVRSPATETLPELFDWRSGRLTFENEPLSNVLTELERWFSVKFRAVGDTLAAQPISTSVAGESLDEVAAVIALALDAEVTREGDVVTFRRR